MITSIFSKSKPVNFVIVIVTIVILYFVFNFNTFEFTLSSLVNQLSILSMAIFSVFLLDFIISKNELTAKHSYGIMILGLVYALFPETLQNSNALAANLLVLFALRRLLSLHTKREIKNKLFDAAFWISLAALFYTWAILFFLVILLALLYYWQNEIKNIIVSALGIVSVFILLLVYNILINGNYIGNNNFILEISFDFSYYNSLPKIIALTVMATLYIWSSIFYIKRKIISNKKLTPIRVLIILASLIAVSIGVIAPNKNGSEFIFLLVPFAIITASYLETLSEHLFKELFVSVLIIASLLILVQ